MLKHLSTYQEYMNFLIEKEKENITIGINIHLDAYYKTCTDIGLTK